MPEGVSLKLSQSLFEHGSDVVGAFDPGGLLGGPIIKLALDEGPHQAIRIGRHEVIHALRGLEFFTDAEGSCSSIAPRKSVSTSR